jgi:hypothetical protein
MEEAEQKIAQTPQPGAGEGTVTVVTAVAKPPARTPAKKKARQLAKHLRGERPVRLPQAGL